MLVIFFIFLALPSFSIAEVRNHVDCLSEKYRTIQKDDTEGSTWKKAANTSESSLVIFKPNYGSLIFENGQFEYCNSLSTDEIHHLQILEEFMFCSDYHSYEVCKDLDSYMANHKAEYLEENGSLDGFMSAEEISNLKRLYVDSTLKSRIQESRTFQPQKDHSVDEEEKVVIVAEIDTIKNIKQNDQVSPREVGLAWLVFVWKHFIDALTGAIQIFYGVLKLLGSLL